MYQKKLVMKNKLKGNQVKAIVMKCDESKCSIWIEKGERKVGCKSFLGILSLQILEGDEISVITEENDEISKSSVDCMIDILISG